MMMNKPLIEAPCGITTADNVTSNMGVNVRLNDVLSIAKERWFKVSELECLLSQSSTPLPISTHTLRQAPKSGTVLLFDRSATRNYKTDGHRWVKKRNSLKVREDHVKLRRNGRNRISGFYAHSEDVKTLHRRCYHLLDMDSGATAFPPGKGGDSPSLVLVHYFDTASELGKIVMTDRGVGKKRRRVVSNEANESSRIKFERYEYNEEVYFRDLKSIDASVLHDECRLLDNVRNRTLLQLYELELMRKIGLGQCLSTLQNVSKQRQIHAEEVCSSGILSKEDANGCQVQDAIDDETLEMLQGLGSTCDEVDKRLHEDEGSIEGRMNVDVSASISSPRSFEADFDVLW
eukprot:CAMPEP_0172489454 /NCGR_PEP_ID=MMETSP1066-20121228/19467_1 /TAXON_ID=671091 /ORGANISM="Coscinodiscus wailesii, Strain CCMP2513" /LENGTH=346 /DNA_ID=CAMNT_0013257333 /DNA_START=83 /DNA_END=1120 /DNA_ORIENTATION=+